MNTYQIALRLGKKHSLFVLFLLSRADLNGRLPPNKELAAEYVAEFGHSLTSYYRMVKKNIRNGTLTKLGRGTYAVADSSPLQNRGHLGAEFEEILIRTKQNA